MDKTAEKDNSYVLSINDNKLGKRWKTGNEHTTNMMEEELNIDFALTCWNEQTRVVEVEDHQF